MAIRALLELLYMMKQDEAGGRTYEDIETITTDKSEESHGTHTSGIAAGSIVGNGLQGMAPDADLYLCGLGNHIFDSIRYLLL